MMINNLAIEITRRCNKECYFCLRGEGQKVNISDEILEVFLKKFSRICDLTISGGEPSLAPDRILKIIDIIKRNKISVGSFYIATNGIEATSEFINSILKLYIECEDRDMCKVIL